MSKSNSSHHRLLVKSESRRWNFRSASCHNTPSAQDLNASCESLDLSSLHDEATPSKASKRPLRGLCRTASARFFASFHGSKSAALVDSSTTVDLTDCDDDDDDDDDSSVCSFENGTVTRSVHFAKDLTETREVENCFYMQPQDRAATWYSRYHNQAAKKQNKMTLLVLKKEQHASLVHAVVDAFEGVQMLADSGFEDADLQTLADTHDTAISNMMSEWCTAEINGEVCRGLEKHVLKKIREMQSRMARSAVLDALKQETPQVVAERYRNLSRYAAIYAESMARADAVAAAAVQNEQASA